MPSQSEMPDWRLLLSTRRASAATRSASAGSMPRPVTVTAERQHSSRVLSPKSPPRASARRARYCTSPHGRCAVMRSTPPLAAIAFIASIVITACGGGGTPTPVGTAAAGSTITVTSLWGGSEQASFQKVLDAFKAKSGVTANYESVRDNYSTILQTRISGGNPPDVAIRPGIGLLRQFARQGSLKKIADIGIDVNALKANYPPGMLENGQVAATA